MRSFFGIGNGRVECGGGQCGVFLQEPLLGVFESAGARAEGRPAADLRSGRLRDARAPRRAATAAAPLRLARRPLQTGPDRGVFTGRLFQDPLRGVLGRAGARARPHPHHGGERARGGAASPRAAAARARPVGHRPYLCWNVCRGISNTVLAAIVDQPDIIIFYSSVDWPRLQREYFYRYMNI